MEVFLFENPKTGILIALLIELVLFLTWAFAREKVKTPWLAIGPILALLFLASDWAVETNREQIIRVNHELAQAVEERNAPAILAHISSDFQLPNGMNKQTFSAFVERIMAKPLFQSNNIIQLTINTLTDTDAQIELTVRTIIDPKSSIAAGVPLVKSTWRIDYIRTPNQQYQMQTFAMTRLGENKPIDFFKSLF